MLRPMRLSAFFLVTVAIFSLALPACGSSTSSPSPTAVSPAAAPASSPVKAATTAGTAATAVATAAAAATAKPATDIDPQGILKYAFGTNGGSNYDPHTATNPFVNTFLFPAYDGLLHFTVDGKIEGQLAESFAFKENGKVLELKLRKGVVFHDGTPFNAEAVKANFDRAKNNAKSTLKADLTSIDTVEVVDAATVQLKLKGPAGSLTALLADRAGMMVSPAALNNTDLDVKPVGAGPYKVTQHQPGKVIVYEKFDKYWDPTRQKLAKIELSMVLDSATRLRGLRSGEYNAVSLDSDQVKDAEKAGLKLAKSPYVGSFILYFNTARSEFKNQKVRQAITMAIDRAAINDALQVGLCAPTVQVFPAGYWANNPTVKPDLYKYDPAQAKKLLAEAGLPNGFSFTAVVINVPFYSTQAEAIQAQLAQIGVKMQVDAIEPAQLLSKFAVEKAADAYFSTTGGFSDPAKAVAQLYLPNSTMNPGGYTSQKIVDLATKGLEGTDQSQRQAAYQELSKVTAEEVLHAPICSGVSVNGMTNKVQMPNYSFANAADLSAFAVSK